jgi:hypothetical protein
MHEGVAAALDFAHCVSEVSSFYTIRGVTTSFNSCHIFCDVQASVEFESTNTEFVGSHLDTALRDIHGSSVL